MGSKDIRYGEKDKLLTTRKTIGRILKITITTTKKRNLKKKFRKPKCGMVLNQ